MPSGGGPQEPFKRISAKECAEMLKKGNISLIDVRNPNEYTAAHIKGSVLIPVDELYGRIEEVPGGKPIIFHCAVGVRSALACEIAAAMGRVECYNMEGGMDAWKASALPFETGAYKKK